MVNIDVFPRSRPFRETAKQQEAKSLFNFKKTYYNLIFLNQLQNLQLEFAVNYQDIQIPGLTQRVDKMVNLHQNQLPSVSQFLKTKPLDLPASGEENDGFITQKRKRRTPKSVPTQLKGQHQNPIQKSRLEIENKTPLERNSFSQKEATQPKDVSNFPRLWIPSIPVVGASRSYASVAKSSSQDKLTSTIEVEIYTKKVQNNVLQIHSRKSTHC